MKQGLLLSRIVLSSGRELIGAVCDYLAVGRGAAVGFAWLGDLRDLGYVPGR